MSRERKTVEERMIDATVEGAELIAVVVAFYGELLNARISGHEFLTRGDALEGAVDTVVRARAAIYERE